MKKAGRQWHDLNDLNAQALQWSLGPAMERPCPQDRSKTVGTVFASEQPLPEYPFNAAETLAVSVGKTPFVRFDLNDYSVPFESVRRNLTVVADEQQLRILDRRQIIAEQVRHYSKQEQIIDPAHLDALRRHKRQAKGHSGQHRLLAVCAETETLLQQSLERGHRLSTTIRLLLEALDDYGAEAFCRAVVQALASDNPHANAVAQILQCEREKHHQPPPLNITSQHPKARIPLKAPSLAPYKQLIPSHQTGEIGNHP